MITMAMLLIIINMFINMMDILMLLPQSNMNIPCNPWLSEGGLLSGYQKSNLNSNLWKSFWVIHMDFGPVLSSSVFGEKYLMFIMTMILLFFSLYELNNLYGMNNN